MSAIHTRTDFGGDQLDTPEGFHYVPFVEVTRDDDGRVIDLIVGIRASHDDADAHEVRLIPSTETDEGDGHGNVFIYEDDEALSHVAWEVAR